PMPHATWNKSTATEDDPRRGDGREKQAQIGKTTIRPSASLPARRIPTEPLRSRATSGKSRAVIRAVGPLVATSSTSSSDLTTAAPITAVFGVSCIVATPLVARPLRGYSCSAVRFTNPLLLA